MPVSSCVTSRMTLCAGAALLLAATPAPPEDANPKPMHLEWSGNMLTITSAKLPGGALKIWYLEAFCRSGSTEREWSETVIPHETALVGLAGDESELSLRSVIEPGVEAIHRIHASDDAVTFDISFHNPTDHFVDVQWAQPCIRVEEFTGLTQETYTRRCFIFTDKGDETLDQLPRAEHARYIGGQVYVPRGIDRADVNPRPLSPVTPRYDLIGCVSADEHWMLAMAWDHTQELFQGVITCIHSDFRIGGLAAGETKNIRGKLYLLPNDPDALLARYRRDFGISTFSEDDPQAESPTR